MELQSFTFSNKCVEIYQRFQELRAKPKTCDIRLKISDKEIIAHKIVLSSMSEYFENLFYGEFSESRKDTVELRKVEYESLRLLVDYIYSGKIKVNEQNIYEIYATADFLLIKSATKLCAEYLTVLCNGKNCLKTWRMARLYQNKKLQETSESFITKHLKFILNETAFLQLSKDEVSDILRLGYTVSGNSSVIIDAAVSWVNHDIVKRQQFLATLLPNKAHIDVTEEYFSNNLSRNKTILSDFNSNKWLLNVYKERYNSQKLQLQLFKTELNLKERRRSVANQMQPLGHKRWT